MFKPKSRSWWNLLVEPFRQIRFGLHVLTLTSLFIGASAWLFINTFWAQYSHVMDIFQVVEPAQQWELILNKTFYSNMWKLAGLYGLFAVALFIALFRLTHRYYGPLISVDRFLEELCKGNYQARLSIRKKDELQELAKKLNSLAEQLEKRHTPK